MDHRVDPHLLNESGGEKISILALDEIGRVCGGGLFIFINCTNCIVCSKKRNLMLMFSLFSISTFPWSCFLSGVLLALCGHFVKTV